MSRNYYLASKAIIPHGYYENIVKNAAATNSIIVVNGEKELQKVKTIAEKIGIPLADEPIILDEYVKMMSGKKNDNSK